MRVRVPVCQNSSLLTLRLPFFWSLRGGGIPSASRLKKIPAAALGPLCYGHGVDLRTNAFVSRWMGITLWQFHIAMPVFGIDEPSIDDFVNYVNSCDSP